MLFNCVVILKDLIELEIFGYVKGVFIGVILDWDGVVVRVDGGILFLDEICELEFNL